VKVTPALLGRIRSRILEAKASARPVFLLIEQGDRESRAAWDKRVAKAEHQVAERIKSGRRASLFAISERSKGQP
jgi:hypothetical protein